MNYSSFDLFFVFFREREIFQINSTNYVIVHGKYVEHKKPSCSLIVVVFDDDDDDDDDDDNED